jgi:hypothetical protein
MSKQTALQWFKDVAYPYLDKESKEYVDILFNHAIQMEREQIIEAANNGCKGMCMIDTSRDGKNYYNETYGGQDE